MDFKVAEKRAIELKEVIAHHCNLYYNNDAPEISDLEFDNLTQELRVIEETYPQLISEDSYSQKVFGTVEESRIVKHNVPMLSLTDVFDIEEVKSFVNRMNSQYPTGVEYQVEPKIDGLSVCIRYANGNLSVGVTRGDGENHGENVTENVKVIKGIPHKLKTPIEYLEVRGEVYMTFSDFDEANRIQDENGEKLFKNPRNCAAGTLRQKDVSGMAGRQLSFFAFNIQEVVGVEFECHADELNWLVSQGFAVVDILPTSTTIDEVMELIEKIGEKRNALDYPIDGAVVKINNLDIREELGNTRKVPRWAVAYKYPPEEKTTIVRNIAIQVGRTGRLTPVAEFDTIQLAGTDVSRATLHNQAQILRLGINVGDEVVVRKAAEIIPEIVSVKTKKSTGNFVIPTECPECGCKTVKEESEVRCVNTACPVQFERMMIHFASREAMDIDGLGAESVKALVYNGYIKKLEDIYLLQTKRDELIKNKIVGKEKSTDNLLKGIEKSKNNSLARLIKGFGVKNIGKHVGAALESKYDSLTDMMTATYEDLIAIDGMGEITANQVVSFFGSDAAKEMIKNLEELGVNCKSHKEIKVSSKFDGLTFVITGTLSRDRKSFEKEIVENGGKVSGSVSKKTSYVLAGEEAGSKLTKAQELGIKVLSESDYNNM